MKTKTNVILSFVVIIIVVSGVWCLESVGGISTNKITGIYQGLALRVSSIIANTVTTPSDELDEDEDDDYIFEDSVGIPSDQSIGITDNPEQISLATKPPITLPSDYFTFIVIPDTQVYSDPTGYGKDYSKSFTDITKWIAKNYVPLKIKMVAHVGDVVDNYNQPNQWKIASNAMKVLDNADVPYGILAGNHDNDKSPSGTATFGKYFPPSRFSDKPWWGGSSDSYNSNSYVLFSGGGQSYVLINLRYTRPANKKADAEWANSIIKKYPSRKIIISTHGYLNYQGLRRYQNQYTKGPITSFEHLWTDIAYPNPNVFMMVSGHDAPVGEAYRIDKNKGGQYVYQILSNYQANGKGGEGRLRKMTFVLSQNKIYVQTFATSLNKETCVDSKIGKKMVYRADGCYETDSNSEFILDLKTGKKIAGPFELKLP